MSEYADILRFISALSGILILFGGARLFLWIRKYFPERKEAITPEQLTAALKVHGEMLCDKIEKTDFAAREKFNDVIGRVQSSFEVQIRHVDESVGALKENMNEIQRKAIIAKETATQADHKTDLIQKDMTRVEQVLMEKIDHLTTLVKREVEQK